MNLNLLRFFRATLVASIIGLLGSPSINAKVIYEPHLDSDVMSIRIVGEITSIDLDDFVDFPVKWTV